MNKTATLLRGGLLMGLLGAGLQAYTSSSQAPMGRTGAPGESTCASCHSGTPVNGGGGSLTVTGIPATGYVPGTVYNVTVRVTDPTASRFGFSLCMLNSRTQTSAGTARVTGGVNASVRRSGNIDYVGHTNAGANNTWTFDWTAPVTGAGLLNLYAVANAANGNGNTGGDHIYTAQLTVPQSVATAVADEQALAAAALMAFPNPATDRLRLAGSAVDDAREVVLIDALGRVVLRRQQALAELDVRNVPAGRYTLRLTAADGGQLVRPVVLLQ